MHDNNHFPIDQAGAIESQPTGLDVTKILWRWKWLAVFGALVGIGFGFVVFKRQTPTYRSFALVQVVYPDSSTTGLDAMDQEGIRGSSRLDESRIIKSTRVVDRAIEIGQLAQQPILEGKSVEEIRDWILDDDRLSVNPSGRDTNTALLDISFTCPDANTSKIVVDSIIAGYEMYLEEAYRSLGDEVVRVVTQAQNNLRASYTTLSEKHASFRKDAPMVWLGDEARNQFAENSIAINNNINEIQIERQKIQAILQQVEEAIQQKRPADGILLMLANDLALNGNMEVKEPGVLQDADTEKKLPFSSAEQRRELMQLQMRQQELLDTVGEQHPSVASIRRRIALLSSQIDHLANSERKLAEEAKQLMKSGLTTQEQLGLWRSSITERLSSLGKQESLLRGLAAEAEQKSKELQGFVTKNKLLNSELASIQQILDGFNETLNRIQILPKTSQRSMETLTPALKGSFYGPNWPPFILGGALAGLALVLGAGFLVEWLDQSFRGPEEISKCLGTGILGHIPQMDFTDIDSSAGIDVSICTVDGSIRDANEAFRAVRTNVYFSELNEDNRIIQVTSPCPGDGKSTLASNLAVSIAQSGRSVLLIDADMRRPRIAALFGKKATMGIGEVILGKTTLASALSSTPVTNLTLLASVKPLLNPSEIVSHQRFQEVLDSAKKAYDYVIIDTPPVLAVADASAVAARVDGVLMTFRLRRDAKPSATESIRTLKSVGANLLGVVVNGVTGTEGYSLDYYAYSYGYEGKYGSRSAIEDVVDEKIDFQSVVPTPKARRRNITHSTNQE